MRMKNHSWKSLRVSSGYFKIKTAFLSILFIFFNFSGNKVSFADTSVLIIKTTSPSSIPFGTLEEWL
jgi:membrane protease subunit (stomatin/prohibitin family)